ncbi:MAG: HNH endonuclease [Acidimicrobiia bacterium]
MGIQPRYTRDELAEAVRTSVTIAEVLTKVGLVPRGGNYESIRRRFAQWDIEAQHLEAGIRARRTPNWGFDDEAIEDAVVTSTSLAQAMRRLGRKPSTSGYRFLNRAILRLDLDTSHMSGSAWSKGRPAPQLRKPLDHYFVKGKLTDTPKLRERLIQWGVKKRDCEECHLTTWLGQPIPLELDHISGDRTDNRLQNLRLLCPNCHALTPTYRGRNIGRSSPGAEIGNPERT